MKDCSSPDRPNCMGKCSYSTRARAKLALAKVRQNGHIGSSGRPLKEFRCPVCGHFHLGGKPKGASNEELRISRKTKYRKENHMKTPGRTHAFKSTLDSLRRGVDEMFKAPQCDGLTCMTLTHVLSAVEQLDVRLSELEMPNEEKKTT